MEVGSSLVSCTVNQETRLDPTDCNIPRSSHVSYISGLCFSWRPYLKIRLIIFLSPALKTSSSLNRISGQCRDNRLL